LFALITSVTSRWAVWRAFTSAPDHPRFFSCFRRTSRDSENKCCATGRDRVLSSYWLLFSTLSFTTDCYCPPGFSGFLGHWSIISTEGTDNHLYQKWSASELISESTFWIASVFPSRLISMTGFLTWTWWQREVW